MSDEIKQETIPTIQRYFTQGTGGVISTSAGRVLRIEISNLAGGIVAPYLYNGVSDQGDVLDRIAVRDQECVELRPLAMYFNALYLVSQAGIIVTVEYEVGVKVIVRNNI